MNKDDDNDFGKFLEQQATARSKPIFEAADKYAQALINRITQAVSSGDLDNTMQGDLELLRAEFLDRVIAIESGLLPPSS